MVEILNLVDLILDLFELKVVAASYAHPLVLLFLGGFIIASAMEDSGLHKRIALKILSFSGTSPSKIIAGFMFTTAALSMWVSNTASTIMMLPIATSVIAFFTSQNNANNKDFAIPLLLSIAYAASIGGTATLIGTPTNIMLASILSDTYGYKISFIDWLIIGLPVVNIGTRQNKRLRPSNVIDVEHDETQILNSIRECLKLKDENKEFFNPYGDGDSASKIISIIKNLDLSNKIIQKTITY